MDVRWSILEHINNMDAPEDILFGYRDIIKSLVEVRRRLKNPVSLRDERPLKPQYIKVLQREEEKLSKKAKRHRKLIKVLIRYNLLPPSKLIPGEERCQFVFSLRSMVMFPLLGEVVSCVNNFSKEPGILGGGTEGALEKKEDQFNLLIYSIEKAIQVLEQAKLLYIRKASGCSVSDTEVKPDNVVSLAKHVIEKEKKQIEETVKAILVAPEPNP